MVAKIIKFTLIFTGIILYILLIAATVFMFSWPWWGTASLVVGTVGLALLWFFTRKILQRRKEKDFVDQVIQQDDQRIKSLVKEEQDQSRQLQEKWREAIETLKKSHLKKRGNSLYVLPWYLVLGESGSGKTTAIQSAGLPSPFSEYSKVSGISGTRNCDWWFFEDSIIIDAAGRYAIPIDEESDKEEWREFMSLLAKYRKKEPLNGLIVTVPADKLMTGSAEQLQEDALTLRKRVNELMISLGAKFPIYLLVTKCDLIQGMTKFCDEVSDASLEQAMGMVNEDMNQEPSTFLQHAFASIGERLSNLRLLVLNKPRRGVVDPSLILFPDEFAKLNSGLTNFATELFQSNPYQESLLFRGLFFSSGQQEGTPYSHFLHHLGLVGSKDVLPGTNRGLFLHDFFATILPRDRKLFAPTQRALEWSFLTRNLGLAAWVTVIIAFCGVLSFSFVKNLAPLRGISEESVMGTDFQGKFVPDLLQLERFRTSLLDIEAANRDWAVPRFGLDESLQAESSLKKRFGEQFMRVLLLQLDQRMDTVLEGFGAETDDLQISNYVTLLLNRIDLLDMRLAGSDQDDFATNAQPDFNLLFDSSGEPLTDEASAQLSASYLSYVMWHHDKEDLRLELKDLKKRLRKAVDVKGDQLKWLVAWANSATDAQPVTMNSFWGEFADTSTMLVPAAFTVIGKERIEVFIKRVGTMLNSQETTGAKTIEAFHQWYNRSYMDSWQQYAKQFATEAEQLRTSGEIMASRVFFDKKPFQSLLQRIATEMEPFSEADLSVWAKQVLRYDSLSDYTVTETAKEDGGIIDKANATGKKLMASINKNVQTAVQGEEWKNLDETVKAYTAYQTALNAVIPLVGSTRATFDLATETYKDDPETGKTPIIVLKRTHDELLQQLKVGLSEADVVVKLVDDSFNFAWQLILEETACRLDSLWETSVLAEVQGVTRQRDVESILFGEDGFAKEFVKGVAAPFLRRSRAKGYTPKVLAGGSVSFTKRYLTFMSRGNVAKAKTLPFYNVGVEALPTEANPGGLQPHATHLELVCSSQSVQLDNYNFPNRGSFTWAPSMCSDTVLQIEVGDIVLTKRYSGALGFPRFVYDFRGGQKVFRRKDFPRQSKALKKQGVEYIKVNYRLSGTKGVLGQLRQGAGQVPETITTCLKK